MPEITTLPPAASTPFELLIPRSEPVANDRFARRLASASEGGEQRQAPEAAAKVKPTSPKKSEPAVADDAPVESGEDAGAHQESTTEDPPTTESANVVAQEAAAAATVIVAAAVPLPVEPELFIAVEGAAVQPESPVPVAATSDVPFADVLAETESPEQSNTELSAVANGEANPATTTEVIVAPVTSTTPNFNSTDQREPTTPAEAIIRQPAAEVSAQPNEGPSPPASRLSATSPITAESELSTDTTEESVEVADEGERLETADEQLTATDLAAAERPEQTEHPAAEARVEPRAETPTPAPREPEPQRTIDRLPGGAAAGTRQSGAADGPVINAQRFVSRVSRAFESARDNGGSIHLRLSPPELGELALRLSLHEGVLTAQIETDTQSARNALLDNLPALRERLAQQEIRIDKFEVDVRQQGSGSNSRESYAGGQSPGDQSPGDQPSPDSRRPRRDVPTETARPARRIATPTASDGRINYVA